MKKSIILCLLAVLLVVPTPANSQIETIINMGLSLLGIGGGKDPYAKARLVELKKILDKNKKELAKLARIEESSQGTELYTQAQLEISRSVEELMRSVSELKAIRSRDGQIRFNDLVVFNQIQQEVNQYLSGYVSAAFLKQLEKQIVNGAARNHTLAQNSGSNIYDLFFGKSGLDARQPANLTDLGTARGEEALHLLQFQTAAQKKKIVQSLLYYKLADELYAQSITLNNALNDEQNGTALDIARRLRQTIMQRMSQSNLQQLISDPPNIGSGFDLMSLGDMGGMPEEMAGMFQKMLDQVNNDAQGFLSNMDGAFQNPQIMDPMAPDMGYFSEQNSPRGLRLTTGERASLQKSAMDMATQAVEYRRKGDALMEESLEKTPLQQVLEMKRARTYMQESYRYLDLSL